jgi:hypothetical protein
MTRIAPVFLAVLLLAIFAVPSQAAVTCEITVKAPKGVVKYNTQAVRQRGSVKCNKKAHHWLLSHDVFTLASGEVVREEGMAVDTANGGGTLGGNGACWHQYRNVGRPGNRPVDIRYRIAVHRWKPSGEGKQLFKKVSKAVPFQSVCPDLVAEWREEDGAGSSPR